MYLSTVLLNVMMLCVYFPTVYILRGVEPRDYDFNESMTWIIRLPVWWLGMLAAFTFVPGLNIAGFIVILLLVMIGVVALCIAGSRGKLNPTFTNNKLVKFLVSDVNGVDKPE